MDSFTRLPVEIVLRIVTCGVLGPRDLASVAQTCSALRGLLSDQYIWHSQALQASLVPSSSKVYDQVPSSLAPSNPATSWSQLVKAAELLEHRFGWTIHGEPVSRLASRDEKPSEVVPRLAQTPVSNQALPIGDQALTMVPEHEGVLAWRQDRRHRRVVLLDATSCKLLWSYSPPRWMEPSSGVHTTIGAIAKDDWLIIGWDWNDFSTQRSERWLSVHQSFCCSEGNPSQRGQFAWKMDIELSTSKHTPELAINLPWLYILDAERQVLSRVNVHTGEKTQALLSNSPPAVPTTLPIGLSRPTGLSKRTLANDGKLLFAPSAEGNDFAVLNLDTGVVAPSLVQVLASCGTPCVHLNDQTTVESMASISHSTQLLNLAICPATATIVLHSKLQDGTTSILLVHGYDSILQPYFPSSTASVAGADEVSQGTAPATSPWIWCCTLPGEQSAVALSAAQGRACCFMSPSRVPDRLTEDKGADKDMIQAFVLDWKFAQDPSKVKMTRLSAPDLSPRTTSVRRRSLDSLLPSQQTMPILASTFSPTGTSVVLEPERARSSPRSKAAQVVCHWSWAPSVPNLIGTADASSR